MTIALRPDHLAKDRLLSPAQRSFLEKTGTPPSPMPCRRKTWHQALISRAGNCEAGLTECAVCIR